MKESPFCPWCCKDRKHLKKHKLEWMVLDDVTGQFVHYDLVHYCFFCGMDLEERK